MLGTNHLATVGTALALALGSFPCAAQGLRVSHLYNLSDFSGALPFNASRVYSDPVWNEVYVLYQGRVRIFNAAGMEVFAFGDDDALGFPLDIAVAEDGSIFVLSYDYSDPTVRTRYYVSHCNYRGEFLRRIEISGQPEQFASLQPDRMLYAGGRLHLLGTRQLELVTIDRDGHYLSGIDFEPSILAPGESVDNLTINGLSIDDTGTIYFSVAVKFRVYRMTPDGAVTAFGESGSSAGQFGVIGGLDTDGSGNIYVTDRVRNTVMVFDPEFRFLTEFGYRHSGPDGLVRPQDVISGSSGKLYITQVGNRGIAVFQIDHDDSPAADPDRDAASTERRCRSAKSSHLITREFQSTTMVSTFQRVNDSKRHGRPAANPRT
ncbi:MAG TPA: hypothetical protein VD788_13880 [Candidatus Polarisedimenticolaceae bacterium]|nr:hypothetical protein [Candidatus Polarisedimenticolaceae bacterium]